MYPHMAPLSILHRICLRINIGASAKLSLFVTVINHPSGERALSCFRERVAVAVVMIIIIRNSYIAPNPTRLAQSTSQFKTRMDQNQYMKHAYTRRSAVNSKVQANMRTSWNHQCNPDMQCSNTWAIETSHDCKSNPKSNKNWVLLEGVGKQVSFQL